MKTGLAISASLSLLHFFKRQSLNDATSSSCDITKPPTLSLSLMITVTPSKLEIDATSEEVAALFIELDRDGSGEVDYAEFLDWFKREGNLKDGMGYLKHYHLIVFIFLFFSYSLLC